MSIRSQIANGLYTKYFYSHIIRCIILIKKTLILTLLIDAVDLVLIVKLITKVINNVLNHHYLQLDLLTNQIDDVFESSLFIITSFKFLML